MQFEIKDLITWASILVGIVAQFFHLRGRITVLEMRQRDLRENLKESLDKIERHLEIIERKIDNKADK